MMATFGPTIRGAQPLGASPSVAHKGYSQVPTQLRRLAMASILSLSGCSSLPAVVKVPTPVNCVKGEPPAKPATTDEAALLKLDDYAATLTTWTERLTLKAYAEKADAVIQACR